MNTSAESGLNMADADSKKQPMVSLYYWVGWHQDIAAPADRVYVPLTAVWKRDSGVGAARNAGRKCLLASFHNEWEL